MRGSTYGWHIFQMAINCDAFLRDISIWNISLFGKARCAYEFQFPLLLYAYENSINSWTYLITNYVEQCFHFILPWILRYRFNLICPDWEVREALCGFVWNLRKIIWLEKNLMQTNGQAYVSIFTNNTSRKHNTLEFNRKL